MHRRLLTLLLLLLAAGLAVTIFYCVRHDRDPAHGAAAPGPGGAMAAAMHRMHEATNRTPLTGDVDRDFVALMIPHHEAAVDMARIYLETGRDPELRRLAGQIISSQEAEIRQMRGRGAAPAAEAPHAKH